MIRSRFVIDYLKHKVLATTTLGQRSAFLNHLIRDVIRDFDERPVYPEVERLRSYLLADKRNITIKDLGAGSQLSNKKTKKISLIAKHNLKSARLAQLLHRLVVAFNPDTLIELGTCLGVTTVYLAKAMPHGKIITIEGCPETAKMAQETFSKAMVTNITIRNESFDVVLPDILKEAKTDFVFIDGNHRKEATLSYFNLCLSQVHENSVMVFDDIYWSEGMKEAWAEIRDHKAVKVTIDLFWVGLVFFIKDHPKQNFVASF